MLVTVATKSLANRAATAMLTILAIAISVSILLSVDLLRREARESFARTVSGVDLIVGARTGQLNLLLYSVFRVGQPTNNIAWKSYQEFSAHPQVAWTIPLSLGDSHRSYPVLGTSEAYFEHLRYGQRQSLAFREGRQFEDTLEAVVGAEVASKLGYSVGDRIVLAHGLRDVAFSQHGENPFTISGILQATGTPVDQTVHVSLAGLEAIHHNWVNGVRLPGASAGRQGMDSKDAAPQNITAFMVGLKSRVSTFAVQHQVNNYSGEPLLAILPGVALSELWQMLSMFERILWLLSVLVLAAALVGMVTMLLAAMRERRREMAVLRAIGAGPGFLLLLILWEALLLAIAGLGLALLCLWLSGLFLRDRISERFGLFLDFNLFVPDTLWLILGVVAATLVCALIPAFSAYRASLHDKLSAGN